MKLGRLTPLGSELFNEYIDKIRQDSEASIQKDLLSSSLYFEVIDEDIEVELRKFKTRFDLAKYLESLIRTSYTQKNIEKDTLFWEALTAFYFDLLCPLDKNKKRSLKRKEYYIPQTEYNRYYKHLLLGPFLIYRAHIDSPEKTISLLCNPLDTAGELYENIAGRQELSTNPAVVEVVTKLYFNPQTQHLKPGSGSKGPGSPRRLAAVLDQFDLTWDLYSASTDEIINILPKEFDKFRK